MFRSLNASSKVLLQHLKLSCRNENANASNLLHSFRSSKWHLQTFIARAITTTPLPEFESHGFSSHDDLYRMSIDQPDHFWGTLARSRLSWIKDFGMVKDCDLRRGHIRWFLDGKINVSGEKYSMSEKIILNLYQTTIFSFVHI